MRKVRLQSVGLETRLTNFRMNAGLLTASKSAVPARSPGKPLRAARSFFSERIQTVAKLVGHRLVKAQIKLFIRRAAVAAQTSLRKRSNLTSELLGGFSRGSLRHDSIYEADGKRFIRVNGSPGQNQIERAAQADQAR